MIGKVIGILFLSRDVAHRAHFKTTNNARHEALGKFYIEIISIADALAEAYQGRHGIIEDIPFFEHKNSDSIESTLKHHLDSIEELRPSALKKEDTALQSLYDEVVLKYLTVLYKLNNLK